MLVNSVARHFIEKCRSLAPQNSLVSLCKNCRNNEDAFREAGSPRCEGCGSIHGAPPVSFGCIKTYEGNRMGFFRYHDGDKSQ